MSKLVLIGGGGHCKSVLDAVLRMNTFEKIVILDPEKQLGSSVMGCEIVGDDSRLKDLFDDGYKNAFITVGSIGDVRKRKSLSESARILGFNYPCIVDPSAVVSEFSKIGKGVFVGKNAVINAGGQIGNHVIVNTGAIIEHDCCIGDYVHISVGARVCGNCVVEDDSFVGAGAVIIQGIRIRSKGFVKAGEVITK